MTEKEKQMLAEIREPDNWLKDEGAFFDRYRDQIIINWSQIQEILQPLGFYTAFDRAWCIKQRGDIKEPPERAHAELQQPSETRSARYDSQTGGFRPYAAYRQQADIVSGKELMNLQLKPAEFVVENCLPLGLSVLGAPPKSFKSYMCLHMALCICQGKDFLGFHTKKCGVLYMDLESTLRRPKQRAEQILNGEPMPDGFFVLTQINMMGNGFAEDVTGILKDHPEIKVVIVDVFKKIRPAASRSIDAYERDYEDYGKIKSLADSLGISILLVTHTTKLKHPEDPFNELTGSAGVMGSIDMAMVIKKDHRADQNAKLYITGRDLEEQCYEMSFNLEKFQWEKLGTHRDMEKARQETEYRNSPIIQTIKALLTQNGGTWRGNASEIIEASQYLGAPIYEDHRAIGKRLSAYRELLNLDGITYTVKTTKKTRGEYIFSSDCLSEYR